MILQANKAGFGPWTTIGVVGALGLRRDGLPFPEVRNFNAIEIHNGVRSINGYFHCVPLADWLDRPC